MGSRVALVFIERIKMADQPAFNIGDVIVAVPAYVGQTVSNQKYTIIATYSNENGFWHVAETVDPNGVKAQVPLNDGGPYLHRIQQATTKPTERPVAAPTKNPLQRDLDALRGDWEKVLGPVARWFLDEARKNRD